MDLFAGTSALFLVLDLALLVLSGWAFVDALIRPGAAFVAAGKLTKPAWLGITGVCLALCLLGGVSFMGLFGGVVAVATIVYLVDVRPAVRDMRPGGSWG